MIKKTYENPDPQLLSAFVDGQLDAQGCEAILGAMERDPNVRDQVYELRRAKDLMNLAFGDARAPTRLLPTDRDAGTPVHGGRRSLWKSLAASVTLLVVGLGSGALGYYCSQKSGDAPPAMAARQAGERVVLHISKSDPRQFAAALDYIEAFLKEHDKPGSQVEVVANAGGLDLMRAGVSPFEKQVADMIRRHDNVHFIACANGIRNLFRRGEHPRFISNVDTGKTAVDHIVDRLQAGWTYVKVDALPET